MIYHIGFIVFFIKDILGKTRQICLEHWRKFMKPLTIFCDSVEVRLNKGTDLLDITPELNRILRDSKIEATIIGVMGE